MIILELSHAIVWFVWNVCSDKAELSFFERETAFWCTFKRVPNWRLVGHTKRQFGTRLKEHQKAVSLSKKYNRGYRSQILYEIILGAANKIASIQKMGRRYNVHKWSDLPFHSMELQHLPTKNWKTLVPWSCQVSVCCGITIIISSRKLEFTRKTLNPWERKPNPSLMCKGILPLSWSRWRSSRILFLTNYLVTWLVSLILEIIKVSQYS